MGWLVKENKVWFSEDTYELKPTNYDNYKRDNEGKIYRILNTYNEIDAAYIPKLAVVTEKTHFILQVDL